MTIMDLLKIKFILKKAVIKEWNFEQRQKIKEQLREIESKIKEQAEKEF